MHERSGKFQLIENFAFTKGGFNSTQRLDKSS